MGCSALTDIHLPKGITRIANGAFMDCSSLKSVVLPEKIDSLSYFFSGCENLEYVTIPDNATKIGHWTFENCKSLKEITIPDSVTKIEEKAFGFITTADKMPTLVCGKGSAAEEFAIKYGFNYRITE